MICQAKVFIDYVNTGSCVPAWKMIRQSFVVNILREHSCIRETWLHVTIITSKQRKYFRISLKQCHPSRELLNAM